MTHLDYPHLDEAVGVPVDRDPVPARSHGVIELVEEEARQRQLRGNPIRDENAAPTTHSTACRRLCTSSILNSKAKANSERSIPKCYAMKLWVSATCTLPRRDR